MPVKNETKKNDVLKRLARIEGQIRGLSKMIEQERPCEEVAHQISAVRAGIGRIGLMLIENKLMECIDIDIEDEKIQTLKRLIIKLTGK